MGWIERFLEGGRFEATRAELKDYGLKRSQTMSCGGCCCGGPDLRTPEEKRACEARRATMVLRVFVWGIILTALAVLAFMVVK